MLVAVLVAALVAAPAAEGAAAGLEPEREAGWEQEVRPEDRWVRVQGQVRDLETTAPAQAQVPVTDPGGRWELSARARCGGGYRRAKWPGGSWVRWEPPDAPEARWAARSVGGEVGAGLPAGEESVEDGRSA